MSDNSIFKQNFAAIIKRAGDRADDVVRKTAWQLQGSLVERSPVGNPDLWKHPAPPGYTGGRFKNNWTVGIGAPDLSTSQGPDAFGHDAMNEAAEKLLGWKAGQPIFLTNSMPYARRLEYEGWSSQAPQGMVRLTVIEFNDAVRRAAAEGR